MQLIQLSESDKPDYNRFVASQPSGSFLQSWEWGQWQEGLGRQVFRFKIVDQLVPKDVHEPWLGATQFIQTPLMGKQYYLYAPYGPVLNKISNFQSFDKLRVGFPIFKAELKKNFSEAVFFRVEPTDVSLIPQLSSIFRKSTNIQPAITMVVDIDKDDNELLAGMHPKTKYNIKIAERHGIEVRIQNSNSDQAIELIIKTQQRQNYRGHAAEYYQQLVNFFAPHNHQNSLKVNVYQAVYQGQILTCGIMVDFGPTRMYLYGGSSDEHRNVMAPYALHWQAIKDGRAAGLMHYDLGGSEVAAGGERGFTRFKQGFGGRVVPYAGAYDIVQKPMWYTIYTVLRNINRALK